MLVVELFNLSNCFILQLNPIIMKHNSGDSYSEMRVELLPTSGWRSTVVNEIGP